MKKAIEGIFTHLQVNSDGSLSIFTLHKGQVEEMTIQDLTTKE